MGDKQHGQPVLFAQSAQQLENLRLNGDVERGGGLVGDEQTRLVDQGHGDHHALALSAGKLMRVIAGAAFGIRDRHLAQGLHGARGRRASADRKVGPHRLRDLVAHAHHGVESGHGLLKNHAHARAPQTAHPLLGQAGQGFTRKRYFAGHPGLRRQKAHDSQRSHGFPRAGFSHEAQRAGFGNFEADIAHRSHLPGLGGEGDVEAVDLEKTGHERRQDFKFKILNLKFKIFAITR